MQKHSYDLKVYRRLTQVVANSSGYLKEPWQLEDIFPLGDDQQTEKEDIGISIEDVRQRDKEMKKWLDKEKTFKKVDLSVLQQAMNK